MEVPIHPATKTRPVCSTTSASAPKKNLFQTVKEASFFPHTVNSLKQKPDSRKLEANTMIIMRFEQP